MVGDSNQQGRAIASVPVKHLINFLDNYNLVKIIQAFLNKKFGVPPALLKKYHQLALIKTLSIVFLQIPYCGDVGTYRVTLSALMASDLDLPFVPCIGGFHLQMEWCQVGRIKCKLDSNVNELPNCCSDSFKKNTYELGERTVKEDF